MRPLVAFIFSLHVFFLASSVQSETFELGSTNIGDALMAEFSPENNAIFNSKKNPCLKDFSVQFIPLLKGGLISEIPMGLEAIQSVYGIKSEPIKCEGEKKDPNGSNPPKQPIPFEILLERYFEYLRNLEIAQWKTRLSDCQDAVCIDDETVGNLDPIIMFDFYSYHCRNAVCLDAKKGIATFPAVALLYSMKDSTKGLGRLCGEDEYCTGEEIETLKSEAFVMSFPQLKMLMEHYLSKHAKFKTCHTDGCVINPDEVAKPETEQEKQARLKKEKEDREKLKKMKEVEVTVHPPNKKNKVRVTVTEVNTDPATGKKSRGEPVILDYHTRTNWTNKDAALLELKNLGFEGRIIDFK